MYQSKHSHRITKYCETQVTFKLFKYTIILYTYIKYIRIFILEC